MGMYENMKDIVKIFLNDETLLRLLYYKPKNILTGHRDPLDTSLSNILVIDHDWLIRDKRIVTDSKYDDLATEPLCRIYVYAGRRSTQNENYLVADQQIKIDIFCHSDFQKDFRISRISDRINKLLISERITGLGKVKYVDGYDITAPIN